MNNNFNINKEFLLKTAKDILEFDSPTGFCFEIMDNIEDIVKDFGYKFERLQLKDKAMRKQLGFVLM